MKKLGFFDRLLLRFFFRKGFDEEAVRLVRDLRDDPSANVTKDLLERAVSFAADFGASVGCGFAVICFLLLCLIELLSALL